MKLPFLLLGTVTFLLLVCNNADANQNDNDVSEFLKYINIMVAKQHNEATLAKLQNDLNKTKIVEQEIMNFRRNISTQVAKFKQLELENPELKMQLSLVPDLGYEVLPEKDLELMMTVIANTTNIYQTAKLCSYTEKNRCNLTYFPEVMNILSATKDAKEIEYYWLEWHRKSVAAVQNSFKIFVNLYRIVSEMNGYSSPSAFWLKDYAENSNDILKTFEKILLQLKPLYQQAHAYVRGQLRLKYGDEVIEYNKPMPNHLSAHFLSAAILQGVPVDLPFETSKISNITERLLKKGATADSNFATAKEFYGSLGMPQLEESFWHDNSQANADLENNIDGRHQVWKFYDPHHVNISYNPSTKETTFFNMFESLADIYYYRATKDLPPLYQKQPIPEFSSILGCFFTLAASSPKYLGELNLVDPSYSVYEARINKLYIDGLKNLFVIPLFYIIERHRLNVIDKVTDIDDNCAYWRLTEDIFGVQPPVTRSKADFDAAAKMIMKLDDQYTKSIYDIVLQYQLFEHFCSLTGEFVKGDPEKPLDLCDLRGHPEVGEKIYKVMSLGSTVEFKEILKQLMNTEELNINGLLEYYRPLLEWLMKENKLKSNEIGWENSNKCQP